MKTKTAAIRHARNNVSTLRRLGNGYYYLVFDEKMNAWIESRPRPYYEAQSSRSYALLWEACQYLQGDDFQTPPYNGGRWTDYV